MATNNAHDTLPENHRRGELTDIVQQVQKHLKWLYEVVPQALTPEQARVYRHEVSTVIQRVEQMTLFTGDLLERLNEQTWKQFELIAEAAFYQHKGELLAREKLIATLALEADITNEQAEKVLWALEGQLSESPVDPMLLDELLGAIQALAEQIEEDEA